MLDKNGLFLVIWCRLVPEQVRLLKKGKREVVCDKEMRMPPLKLRIVFKMHKRRLFNVH